MLFGRICAVKWQRRIKTFDNTTLTMIFIFATLVTLAAGGAVNGIDTVVAIMYENRAFDHLL